MSSVVLIEACPMRCWITFGWRPSRTSNAACERRKSWNAHSSPTVDLTAAAHTPLLKIDLRSPPPSGQVNTDRWRAVGFDRGSATVRVPRTAAVRWIGGFLASWGSEEEAAVDLVQAGRHARPPCLPDRVNPHPTSTPPAPWPSYGRWASHMRHPAPVSSPDAIPQPP